MVQHTRRQWATGEPTNTMDEAKYASLHALQSLVCNHCSSSFQFRLRLTLTLLCLTLAQTIIDDLKPNF